MVGSALVVCSGLEVLEEERLQQLRAGEVRSYDREEPPALLAAVELTALVVGRLLHDLAVHLILDRFASGIYAT